MTEDLLRGTAIAHALIALITATGADTSDPRVRAGFDAAIDAIGISVEKAVSADSDAEVAALQACRAEAHALFTAADPDDRAESAERLRVAFDGFAAMVPGYATLDVADEDRAAPAI